MSDYINCLFIAFEIDVLDCVPRKFSSIDSTPTSGEKRGRG